MADGASGLRLDLEALRASARGLERVAEDRLMPRRAARSSIGGTGRAELDACLAESVRALERLAAAHRADVRALARALDDTAGAWDWIDIYLSGNTG